MALLFYGPRPHPFTTLLVGRDFEKRGNHGAGVSKTDFDSTWKLVLFVSICFWSFWGWPLVLNDCKRPPRRGVHKRASVFSFAWSADGLIRYCKRSRGFGTIGKWEIFVFSLI